MGYVNPSSLDPDYPSQPFAEASAPRSLVHEKFEQAQEYAGDALTSANAYLAVLRALFASAEMPEADISYDFQEGSLDVELPDVPTAPSDADLTPTPQTPPSLGDIPGVTIPSITLPEDDIGSLEVSYDYDEAAYTSEIGDAVKAALLDYVQNGGTGLGADVEAAIWARARARKDLENERIYTEALEYFEARGHTLPPGALSGRLIEAMAEQTRANAQINYEIMIEQARLARAQGDKALELSVAIEGVEKEFATAIANRAFQKAKNACDVIIDTYNAKVAAYAARMETAKVEAQVGEVIANTQVAAGNQVVAIYTAELDRYKADVAQELGIIETIAKVYNYKMNGYEAEAKIAVGLLEAQIKQFEAKIEQANNQTQLSIKEAELVLQSYLGALALQTEAAKGGAMISAQIAASALNSVNASASLGFSVSRGQDEYIGHATHISESGSLSESHSYQHEA